MEFPSNPIHERTSKVAMITLALIIFLSALILAGVQTFGFNVSLRFIGAILMITVFLNVSEVIGKRFTGISELKILTSQQKVTLIINTIAFIVAILLLFEISITFLAGFGTGILFLQGGTVLLEAFR